ncbi:MAG: response regulator transcription factor [Anaerolineales bacterium]|nr:response regulator transcription factor [Anaerolineales bacterium]
MVTKTRETPIRVLLVDDHVSLRQGLTILLNQQPQIDIVAQASNGMEALEKAAALKPDVVLLDLMLPDMEPTALCFQLRQVSHKSKILVFSGIDDGEKVYTAVDAGIDGYAVKSMNTADLTNAISQVASGQSYLHPTITRLILHRAASDHKPAALLATAPPRLTERQLEVLLLMASTSTNGEIAERLTVSEETVRTHVKNILRKLNVSNRTQAVLEAVRLGIITV